MRWRRAMMPIFLLVAFGLVGALPFDSEHAIPSAECPWGTFSRRSADATASGSGVDPTTVTVRGGGRTDPVGGQQKPTVLIIDVDNCIYSEEEARAASRESRGVEDQIVTNTHDFGSRRFNLTKEECDDLYREYGSTVEGLRHKLGGAEGAEDGTEEEILRKFYREVYDGIDMACLIPRRGESSTDDEGRDDTGYSHGKTKRRHLADLLDAAPCPVFFASNSPRAHVLKVLTALGLRDIRHDGIVTPDCHVDDGAVPYATKSSPARFYRDILEKHPVGENRVILLDDSELNLERASTVGIEGLHVGGGDDGLSLEEAIAVGLRHIEEPPPPAASSADRDGTTDRRRGYEFSDVRYLRGKNEVDVLSIDESVWNRLGDSLSSEVVPSLTDGVLRVADVGAGLLSMLELFLSGGGGKESLLDALRSRDSDGRLNEIRYHAYEPNANLLDGCRAKIRHLGFEEAERTEGAEGETSDSIVFRRSFGEDSDGGGGVLVTVHLRMRDFAAEPFDDPLLPPDLVVGCCFADLFDPHELVRLLLRFTRICSLGGGGGDSAEDERDHSGTLVYFPITFAGTTQFHPPRPFGVVRNNGGGGGSVVVPSDTVAFRLYGRSLSERHGHNLDPGLIVEAVNAHGGELLASGKSDWVIDHSDHGYLWETMMYFFGMSGAAEMTIDGWDSEGWIGRALKDRPRIIVSNVDLLFRLGSARDKDGRDDSVRRGKERQRRQESTLSVDEIQFQAPRKVGKVTKRWMVKQGEHLGPSQVEVESVCSLISSGTELKVFKGLFDDAALDVNIKDMADERMAYPLSYGYSLVGRVTRCGPEVRDADEIMGKLVFTFSPHSSRVVTERDAVQLVPDGIDAEDAIFMPSVETALSLVHDANVRLGENVAVFGQGLIGLLVTRLLSLQGMGSSTGDGFGGGGGGGGRFGTVTTFDAIVDRLAASSAMGASQALLPSEAAHAGPFDVSVEVSGNGHALQSAIDMTSPGGRVVVGSWYGNADVRLKLGMDFHRSRRTIVTSQVSEVPAELGGLWSKGRRFGLTWELVRRICPSRLITRTVGLDEAQRAYELLDAGKEIAVAFRYNSSE